jgi:hypothetical protein
MARLSIGQRAQRVTAFLVSLRHERITRALRRHGFREKDRLEGHRLLRALTDGVLAEEEVSPSAPDASLLHRLDEWENQWYPIIEASLRYRFPEAHAFLFRNLRQTAGPELIVGLGTLLSRLDELASEAPRGKEARALLVERGLTDRVLDIARAALSEVDEDPPVVTTHGISDEALKEREDAMWHWYLEWSTIARQSITDRRLLRALGFLSHTGAGAAEGVDDDEADETETEAEPPPVKGGAVPA